MPVFGPPRNLWEDFRESSGSHTQSLLITFGKPEVLRKDFLWRATYRFTSFGKWSNLFCLPSRTRVILYWNFVCDVLFGAGAKDSSVGKCNPCPRSDIRRRLLRLFRRLSTIHGHFSAALPGTWCACASVSL